MIEFLKDLVSGEADRHKLTLFAFIVITAFAGILVYEDFTTSFTLARLQKNADLISKLQEIDKSITPTSNPELVSAFKKLAAQTSNSISETLLPLDAVLFVTGQPMREYFYKFIAGGCIWIFLGLVGLIDYWRRKNTVSGIGYVMKGVVRVAFVSGVFCAIVPKVYWHSHSWVWFHMFIYPILFAVFTMIVIYPFIQFKPDPKAHEKTEGERKENDKSRHVS